MYKKLLSILIVLAILAGVAIAIDPFSSTTVKAEDFRGGYMLEPVDSDSTGVLPESGFILKSRNPVKQEELEKFLTIDGEPAPVITAQGDSFLISPSRQLEQNKLYTFRIKQAAGQDIIWTFQTSAVFKILAAFPGDKTVNVPVNSGIEIYFSHEDYEDIEKYFEISPPVKGTFERHKKAAVFVPEELKEGTLYTVKLKSGLKLKNTGYSLKEDYVFRFETEVKKPEKQDIYINGTFSYNKFLNEYSTLEKPVLPINYYINRENVKESAVKVKTAVYAYRDMDAFIQAIGKKDATPVWAYNSYMKNLVSNEGLSKVVDFEQQIAVKQDREKFINIPQSLPAGYYLVDSVWDKMRFQTFIEVTDMAMYISKTDNKTLVWINDLSSGKPVEGAEVSIIGDNGKYYSDKNGIACFDTPAAGSNTVDAEPYYVDKSYLKINAKDGKSAILNYYSYSYMYYGSSRTNTYWNYLYLDRNLYKPDDTVNFWGLMKNRYSGIDAGEVTMELGKGYSYYSYRGGPKMVSGRDWGYIPGSDQPMVKQTVKTEDGIFKGNIRLPSLEPGGYQLTIKNGDETVVSSYINVENYSKPAYKVEITKDREAIFPWQEVNFDIKASFFEGTGVPGLSLDYNTSGNIAGEPASGKGTTGTEGSMPVKYRPLPAGKDQGENYVGFYCHASLPEIGEITENSSIRVFVNDINVSLASDIRNNKGTLSATVNKVVLDRLNDGTAKDSNDYLGDAVPGKTLTGTIYRNTWVKVEAGQYYDYINKVTRKSYNYDLHTEPFREFSMSTDGQGKASFTFDAPEIENGFYNTKLTCSDDKGRGMKLETYIGKYYEPYNYDDNRYYLDGGKEKYATGDTVGLTFKKGKAALPEADYLFIKMQNGIRDFTVSGSPAYSFGMTDKDIPNVYVQGVYFNGVTYIESERFNAVYDYKVKDLVLDAKTDKKSYKPGEEAIIKVQARDRDGNPKKAVVNVSIVDEALFKLQDQTADMLAILYTSVPAGVDFTYSSHINSGMDASGARGTVKMKNEMKAAEQPKLDVQFSKAFGGAADMYIRQDFKDTAFFKTFTLDEKGYGELKFKLPDNVTSWRVTLSGTTPDMSAGSSTESLNVTLPFFINYTLNSTYLEGDLPVVGATAYGSSLKQQDEVTFEASDPLDASKTVRVRGKAFERVNIPLWKLGAGKQDILLKAYTAGGLQDAVKHGISVVTTYHQMDKAVYYDLIPGLKFQGGTSGNTRLIFSDRSRGAFLPDLTGLMYTHGNRIDQKLSVQVASGLIKEYFNEYEADNTDSSFKASEYQREDGGIALLPYGSSDPDMSAKLVSLIKDQVDANSLKQYFYSILGSDGPGLKANMLYGLAVLKEPVLLDMDNAVKVENMDMKDVLFLALAYCELGELSEAQKLFEEKVRPEIEEFKPYLRVNTGKDSDDVLEATSLASVLASKLDKPEKTGLYGYCTANRTDDLLVNAEMLLYIKNEIGKYKEGAVKFTYDWLGEKHEKSLKNGETFTISVPSEKLQDFGIENVEGDISVVSLFKAPVSNAAATDDSISVTRRYSPKQGTSDGSNTFRQNDIIRVDISWDFGPKAMDGGYEITDYLPSGLKPIENPWNYGAEPGINSLFRRIDGQKVTFYVYNGWKNENRTLSYYARVISPGIYKADGTIIQGLASGDSMNIGRADTVKIE